MQDTFYLRWFYQVLLDFGSVSLPGVGTYILNRKNAAFILNRTQLQPPSTYLTFLPEYDSNKDFRAILIKSGLQPEISATAALSIANALHPSNGVGLEALMIKSWPKEFNKYAGLPILDVKPSIFAGFKSNIGSVITPFKEAIPTFNLKYIWILALVTSLLIGVFMYLRVNEKPTFAAPSELTSPADTSIIYTEDTMVIIDQSSSDTSELDTTVTNKQTEVVTPVVSPKVEEAKPIKTAVKSITPPRTGSCIVIVGAFGNANNAQKMTSKLQKLGYKTYTNSAGSLTRVGLYFECGISNQDQFKSKIRKQIAQDAWFLHDTIANN